MCRKVQIFLSCFLLLFTGISSAQSLLTLDEAVRQTLENSFDIKVSKNDAEIAAVSNSWALAGRYPTADANIGYNYSLTNLQQNLSNGTTTKRNGASTRTFNSNVTGTWMIFNGYRVHHTKNRLEELEKVGDLNLKQQSNQTVFDVITAYYNIARLQQQSSSLQQNIKLFEERVKLSKARFEIGTAAKNDYLQSQVDLNDQRNSLLLIEKDMLDAKTSLNNLMSRNPDTQFAVNDSADAVTVPAKSAVLAGIDSLNPQLLASKANEVVIMYQHREIRSQLYPTLNLNAGGVFNRNNNSAGFTLLNQTLGPQAGFTLAIPLFQGGIVKKQLKINDIQLSTQKIQTELTRNQLQTTLVNAYNEYENAKKQYDLQQQSLDLVKENSMIAMERFRRAAITLVDLRQVQISLVTTQTNLINALFTMKIDAVTLQYLTGALAN